MLAGKRTLVTGGSRGLGRALCQAFTTAGARVAFTWTRDEDGARDTRARCGPQVRDYRVSVLDVPGTEAVVADLEQAWGGLDVLVNNTGVSHTYPVALLEEEDWDRVMDVNVKGAFLTARAVLPGMVRRKAGVILNIGSIAGARMLEAPVHYCASKAALKGLTQALAPGLLAEGMGQNLPDSAVAEYLRHCALGRLGTLEEVAGFAVFLVSDHNSYMSGETIIMDGGV